MADGSWLMMLTTWRQDPGNCQMTVHTLARIPSRAESTEASADVSQKHEHSKSSWGVWKQSNFLFCTGWTRIYMKWYSLQALFGNWNRGISSSMSSESLTPSGTSAPSATETTSVGPLSEKHAKLCVLPILDSCQNASLPSFIPSYLHSLCFLYSSCNPKTPTLP